MGSSKKKMSSFTCTLDQKEYLIAVLRFRAIPFNSECLTLDLRA